MISGTCLLVEPSDNDLLSLGGGPLSEVGSAFDLGAPGHDAQRELDAVFRYLSNQINV